MGVARAERAAIVLPRFQKIHFKKKFSKAACSPFSIHVHHILPTSNMDNKCLSRASPKTGMQSADFIPLV